jgi:hypothetical protein
MDMKIRQLEKITKETNFSSIPGPQDYNKFKEIISWYDSRALFNSYNPMTQIVEQPHFYTNYRN